MTTRDLPLLSKKAATEQGLKVRHNSFNIGSGRGKRREGSRVSEPASRRSSFLRQEMSHKISFVGTTGLADETGVKTALVCGSWVKRCSVGRLSCVATGTKDPVKRPWLLSYEGSLF